MPLVCKKLSPAIGAEVTGLDLFLPFEAHTARMLSQLLLTHGMLAFRDQAIGGEAQARLGRCFGELARFRPTDNWDGAVPEIFRGANIDASGEFIPAEDERARMLKLNWLWHIDGSYRAVPPRGAVLRGIDILEDAGDTLFVNLFAAYDALPEETKRRIDGLFVRHSFEYMVDTQGMPPLGEGDAAALPPAIHPLARRHADGRHSLYLSPPYMETILGWEPAESRALIHELTAWSTQERFLCRHRVASARHHRLG